jgi:hypothetical protein
MRGRKNELVTLLGTRVLWKTLKSGFVETHMNGSSHPNYENVHSKSPYTGFCSKYLGD